MKSSASETGLKLLGELVHEVILAREELATCQAVAIHIITLDVYILCIKKNVVC